jgi:hypothetical protein
MPNYSGPISVNKTVEKEMQDTSCRESGGVPSFNKSPNLGGFGG